MKLLLNNVRLAYPAIFRKDRFDSFSATFILEPDDEQVDTMNDAINQVAQEKWESKGKAIVAQLRGTDKVCLHNGDTKADQEGFAGAYFVRARSQIKPLVLGRNKEVLTAEDGLPYGGCYVNASIEIWAQDNKDFGKRVNATLKGVQFFRGGVAFAGGAPASPEDFEDVGDIGDEQIG
jgi:hypothetical protein